MKSYLLIVFWSPLPVVSDFCVDFFEPLLRRHGDIRCFDCGSCRDRRTMRLLAQADLAVVILPQNERILDIYFRERNPHLTNVVYLITDSVPLEYPDRTSMCRRYRLDANRLAFFPYNARYREARRRGKGGPYLRFSRRDLTYDDVAGFRRELFRAVRLLLLALERDV